MKKIIYYFSGTGNSRWIAETLARDLNDKVIMINNDCERCDVSAGERILWVFPIYSWGLPPVVKTFIRNIKLNNDGTTHYMVCSCGDDIGLAHRQWRKEITRRGWEAMASYSVIILPSKLLLCRSNETFLIVYPKSESCSIENSNKPLLSVF
mgnify:CR=1 FL=1